MPPVIDSDTCQRCGTCYDICPQDIFGFAEDQVPTVVYPDECWHCGSCVMDCPVEAVRLRLPLHLRLVPSPALYGPPDAGQAEALKRAAAFSRSVTRTEGEQP